MILINREPARVLVCVVSQSQYVGDRATGAVRRGRAVRGGFAGRRKQGNDRPETRGVSQRERECFLFSNCLPALNFVFFQTHCVENAACPVLVFREHVDPADVSPRSPTY